jgi:uncharacterized membrane protein
MSEDKPVESQESMEEPKQRLRRSSNWVGGVVLIFVGLVFLLQNVTSLSLGNWWAIFILIPAVASLGQAWRLYREQGRISSAVRGPLTGGLILVLVAVIFLFNLDWGKVWPLFLIIIGLGALLSGLL